MDSLSKKKKLISLNRRKDFDLVFKQGFSLSSKHFVIYARANDLDYHRLGLLVSKKVGKAVVRNRIRRLIKEAMRRLIWGFPISSDFVIISKRNIEDINLDVVIDEVQLYLKRYYEKFFKDNYN